MESDLKLLVSLCSYPLRISFRQAGYTYPLLFVESSFSEISRNEILKFVGVSNVVIPLNSVRYCIYHF